MTRKKVKLAFIANDSSRKATFKKRKKGLMKKVNELSTLCGVTACAIIYSPYDTNPEVWPSNSGVERVVSEFRTLPEMDQHKKMVDQETFLRQRIAKATEQLRKQRKENREMEMTEVMFQDVKHRTEFLRNSGMEIGESSNAVAVEAASEGIGSLALVTTATTPTATINEVGSSSSAATFFNPLQHQQFPHPPAPYFGLYEQHRNLNNHQSQQQWFGQRIHSGQLSYAAGEQMGFPFMDDNRHNRNHHHQPQQQQQQDISGDSSMALAPSSSSSLPVTSPNPTNNIWFH
ncbi:Agamous-like MADS-box protein AGL80 [Cardamine amara subsp. amara]|uniref:Agamous-like MADS-box protein AGL80 n=1 Tax=Cardamine amara subsp. amara TaxID=228776 RepID=A0ABD0ZZI1_CARAN